MFIEDTDTNPGVAETELVPATEEVTEPETEVEELEPEAEGQTEEELEDYEYEGKRASIPKWLKPQLMMQADYTKKTQEVAETRKSYESKAAELDTQRKAFQQDVKEHAALHALVQSIEEYQKQDWRALFQQDSTRAQLMRIELDQMRDAASRIASGLREKHEQRQLEAERDHANRIKDRDAVLAKDISGFTPALMSKIQEYAVSDGYTSEEAQSLVDPRYVKTLNKARLWDEYQAKTKAAAAKAKQQEQPVVQATPVVSARKATSNRLSDDMPIDKWMELRRKQVAARDR